MASLTEEIIDIAVRPAGHVPYLPLDFAKLSLLDWMTCAIAEMQDASAKELVTSFLLGAESAIRVGPGLL